MFNLLLNPNGRIQRNRFWQGMVILTVASVLVAAAFRLVYPALWVFHLVLIFPYICIVGKRLHDCGLSAWLSILVWIGAIVVSQIISALLGPLLLSPEIIDTYDSVMKMLEANEVDAAMEGLQIILRGTLSLATATAVLTGVAVAILLGVIPSQPSENKHGPAPGTSSVDTFS